MSPVAVFTPPVVPLAALDASLHARGYALLAAADVVMLAGVTPEALAALVPSWDALAADGYLKDGGRYRRRRHACFVAEGDALWQVPHRMHYQPVEYNALHGGMQRWFEPVDPATVAQPAWPALIRGLAQACWRQASGSRWHVEAHQFRIDTTDGVGRPTPEGAHRDGVDFVAVLLVGRHAIRGGETRVFAADRREGERFTLGEPWSLLLMNDARVIHESTPILPTGDEPGHRDTLVLTFRATAFLGED